MVGLWRRAGVELAACHAQVIEQWWPAARERDSVAACTVSLADADQGSNTHEPDANGLVSNCDVVIALGLERAHDLDDVPERDALHAVARRLEIWRVDQHRQIEWERTWPDGEEAPGLKWVSFMRRAEGLTHEQFTRHWTEHHAVLARRHHVALWSYTQNVVRRAFTPGGADIDGIAELCFRSRDDLENRFFDSDEGADIIMADVKKFMAKPRGEAALMRELPLRT
jgi:uncharacterized protein (TIGR02118 family)